MKMILPAIFAAAFTMLAEGAPARAVDKEDIDRAVQRGVQAVRRSQAPSGQWMGDQDVGITALSALTLLECDVPLDDQALRLAVKYVRSGAVREAQTYSLALAILLLDRLGDPVDEALIESLTVRLLAGQRSDGGWGYGCPPAPADEQQFLNKQVQGARERKERRVPTKPGDGKPSEDQSAPNKPLDKEHREGFLRRVQEAVRRYQPVAVSDNSNTQFAVLALWVARRHGLPVEATLARVEQRFRDAQSSDGSWPYVIRQGEPSTSTMTAAGVLCLAIADAAAGDLNRAKDPKAPARDIQKDKHLLQGIKLLGTVVDDPTAKKKDRGLPATIPQVGGKTYYFLWTLERVCVALDFNTLGNKDWYTWGAEIVLANQKEDGSWKGEYVNADTCFALLFLRRANLAKDLTVSLKGKLADPGEHILRPGGVGGAALKGNVVKPPIEVKTEPKGLDEKTERGKLAKEIVQARGAQQEKLIEKCRDEKGVAYTEALASAIPHLNGEAKNKARDALAERLARMKAETLTNYLKDEEPEIRSAAAVACALKDSKAHVPQLIELLRDKDGLVARAAVTALKNLTGQNFGPSANATAAERDKAITAWQDWWKKQQK